MRCKKCDGAETFMPIYVEDNECEEIASKASEIEWFGPPELKEFAQRVKNLLDAYEAACKLACTCNTTIIQVTG